MAARARHWAAARLRLPESVASVTLAERLAERLARLIDATGPISLAVYMAEANAAYYGSRDPLGVAGDFTTAPEISQMFGEIIGVALADVWRRAGSPAAVGYVELGPGRGTLARDALGVLRRFGCGPAVHLVETSPVLRAAQARLVPDARWHDDLATVPDDAPMLLVANEFFDALPIRQIVRAPWGWGEAMVGMFFDEFVGGVDELSMADAVPLSWRDAPVGSVMESCPAAAAIMGEIAVRLVSQGGAAIVVDYGCAESRLGSTLQAVRKHARADPFATPGEVDLTAHVDFAALAGVARAAGAQVLRVAGQGEWLRALGIEARAAALARAAPAQAAGVDAALQRLTAPEAMGDLFKVMAMAGRGWPLVAGVE